MSSKSKVCELQPKDYFLALVGAPVIELCCTKMRANKHRPFCALTAFSWFIFRLIYMPNTIWNPEQFSCYAWLLRNVSSSPAPTAPCLVRPPSPGQFVWLCRALLRVSPASSPSPSQAKCIPGVFGNLTRMIVIILFGLIKMHWVGVWGPCG